MGRGGRPAIWKQDWHLAWGPESRLSPRSPVLLLLMLPQRQWAVQAPQDDGNIPSQTCVDLLLLSFTHPFAWNVYGSNSRNLALTNNPSCFEENESLLGMFLPRQPDRKEAVISLAFPLLHSQILLALKTQVPHSGKETC